MRVLLCSGKQVRSWVKSFPQSQAFMSLVAKRVAKSAFKPNLAVATWKMMWWTHHFCTSSLENTMTLVYMRWKRRLWTLCQFLLHVNRPRNNRDMSDKPRQTLEHFDSSHRCGSCAKRQNVAMRLLSWVCESKGSAAALAHLTCRAAQFSRVTSFNLGNPLQIPTLENIQCF